MAAPKLVFSTPAEIKLFRRKNEMSQAEFWSRIGVTQSGGSRYESGRSIPRPVQQLLHVVYGGLGSNGTKNQRKPYQRFSVSSSQAPISTKQLRMSASWLISVSRSCTLLSSSSSLRYGMVNS